MQKINCAVLGPKHTYHSQAAEAVLGRVAQLHCNSFAEIIAAVTAGKATFGIVAVENSSIGTIAASNKVLQKAINQQKIVITGEYKLPIQHVIAGISGSSLKNITHVVSHPAAIRQCQQIITRNNWEAIPVQDTASGIMHVVQENNPILGAIASKEAATAAGLTILKQNIQDEANNFSVFRIFTAVGALPEYRQYLDSIDAELLQILSSRQQLIRAIAYSKQRENLSTLDEKREKEIVSRQLQQAQNLDLHPKYIEEMYSIILNYSKKKQKEQHDYN